MALNQKQLQAAFQEVIAKAKAGQLPALPQADSTFVPRTRTTGSKPAMPEPQGKPSDRDAYDINRDAPTGDAKDQIDAYITDKAPPSDAKNAIGTLSPNDYAQLMEGVTPAPTPPLTMGNPNFVNSITDYWKLTPQQRQQAVSDYTNWQPGQMPQNQIVNWGDWLAAATSPTQMTAPKDTRISQEEFDKLSVWDQQKLANPMNALGGTQMQDGAQGSYQWYGPQLGYEYNINDYSNYKQKVMGQQKDYAQSYGDKVAEQFQPGLLQSIDHAAKYGNDKDRFIQSNLQNFMANPGWYNLPNGQSLMGGPTDPLSQLGRYYDSQQEIQTRNNEKRAQRAEEDPGRADRQAAYRAKYNLPPKPEKEPDMNLQGYATGTMFGGGGSMPIQNAGGPPVPGGDIYSRRPAFEQKRRAMQQQMNGFTGNPAPSTGEPVGPPPMTGGSAGIPGMPSAPMPMPMEDAKGLPIYQRPAPPPPVPYSPSLPGGTQGQRPNGLPMPMGGGTPGMPTGPMPMPNSGNTSTWPSPDQYPPQRPQAPGLPPYNPAVPGGTQGTRPNGMPVPGQQYGPYSNGPMMANPTGAAPQQYQPGVASNTNYGQGPGSFGWNPFSGGAGSGQNPFRYQYR